MYDYIKLSMNNKKLRKKIALFHREVLWGGAEAVLFWMIEALKKDYELTLFTTYFPVELNEKGLKKINQFFGTSIKLGDFQLKKVYQFLPLYRFFFLKNILLSRVAKKVKKDFDLLISSYNEMDLGGRGIQYIHEPNMKKEELEKVGIWERKGWRKSFIYKIYSIYFPKIFSYSEESMKKNLTLVNSFWMKKVIKRIYGISAEVLYPPVFTEFEKIPFDKKEDGFLCIGRICHQKRIEKIIEILKEVKKDFPQLHLHIIGPIEDYSYFQKLKPLFQKNKSWIFFEGKISREKLHKLILTHKYGIHGFEKEHFGISIAEMVKGGCLVFVPNGGGQIEIVKRKELIYDSKEDAIKKIKKALSDKNLQKDLLNFLKEHSKIFSVDEFKRKTKEIIKNFLEKKS